MMAEDDFTDRIIGAADRWKEEGGLALYLQAQEHLLDEAAVLNSRIPHSIRSV